VERWKDSGLSAKEFAAETGVKASALSYWKWKLGASGGRGGEQSDGTSSAVDRKPRAIRKPRRSAAGFVEVTAGTVTTTSSLLEIVLSCGVRVRVPTGFDEETLMRVVRAVEASP
jgi:hypothetical protein